MDNNKNRKKDRPKSNPELRKMEPKNNADAGIENGHKTGVHESGHEKSNQYNGMLPHNINKESLGPNTNR